MRKRIGALLLSLGMMASLLTAVPASAEGEPKTGSITVHKFEVKTLEAYEEMKKENTNSSGLELDISKNETLKDLRPLEGIEFTLTKVQEPEGEKVDVNNVIPIENPIVRSTDANGEVKFGELELGLYKLEEEEDDPRIKIPMDPVLISVPTYIQEHKDGSSVDEFNYDIHVYPKNLIHQDGPDIGKDVVEEGNNDASVNIGEEFDWIILGDVPKDMPEEPTKDMYYRILDTLDPKLDFVATKSVVLRSADETQSQTLNETEHYTFTRKNDTGEVAEDGRNLTWELTTAGMKAMKDFDGGQVVVTFTTKLNESAKEALGQAIENKAELQYRNESGTVYNPESDKPEVHTGGVKIKKVDKADPTKILPGAKFKIYKTEEDAKAGTNAIPIAGKEIVESDAKGIADFYGLAYYTDDAIGEPPTEGSTTYWVVETEAPIAEDGTRYNRLKDPFEVTVTATSHKADPETYKVVYNAKDNYELPFTGGTGIVIFLGAGAVLLIAGYVISRNGKNKAAK